MKDQIDWDDVKPIKCTVCESDSKYRSNWDAHYCIVCDIWLSKKCTSFKDDTMCGCLFACWERPDKPGKPDLTFL